MYALEDKHFESLIIGVDNGDGSASQITVKYYSDMTSEETKFNLESIEKNIGSSLDFTEKSLAGRDLYTAPYTLDSDAIEFAGYVQNSEGPGGIQVFYYSKCQEEACENLEQKAENNALKLWKYRI